MNIQLQEGGRLEKIVKMLLQKEQLINEQEKGSIEINFHKDSSNVALKIVIQSN